MAHTNRRQHGQVVSASELAIQWSQGGVMLWPLTQFVLGFPEFKSLAMLVVNSQVVLSRQLGFLTLVCCI